MCLFGMPQSRSHDLASQSRNNLSHIVQIDFIKTVLERHIHFIKKSESAMHQSLVAHSRSVSLSFLVDGEGQLDQQQCSEDFLETLCLSQFQLGRSSQATSQKVFLNERILATQAMFCIIPCP